MSSDIPQWVTRDDLRDTARVVQDQIDRRFQEMRDRGDERHGDNVERLELIMTEVRKTNGRVTTLEANHKTLADEFQAIRRRWHDFRDSIQNKLSSDGAGENRRLTMRDVYLFAGGASMLFALMKLLKVL